jgi:hypothetical protein
VNLWNLTYFNFGDISMGHLAEVRFVGFPSKLVPLTRKNADSTVRFHGETYAANTSEQVSKAKFRTGSSPPPRRKPYIEQALLF